MNFTKEDFDTADAYNIWTALVDGLGGTMNPFSNPIYKQAAIPQSNNPVTYQFGSATKANIPYAIQTTLSATGAGGTRYLLIQFLNENDNDIYYHSFTSAGINDGGSVTLNAQRPPVVPSAIAPYSSTNIFTPNVNYGLSVRPPLGGTDLFLYSGLPISGINKGLCTAVITADGFVLGGDTIAKSTIKWIELDINT